MRKDLQLARQDIVELREQLRAGKVPVSGGAAAAAGGVGKNAASAPRLVGRTAASNAVSTPVCRRVRNWPPAAVGGRAQSDVRSTTPRCVVKPKPKPARPLDGHVGNKRQHGNTKRRERLRSKVARGCGTDDIPLSSVPRDVAPAIPGRSGDSALVFVSRLGPQEGPRSVYDYISKRVDGVRSVCKLKTPRHSSATQPYSSFCIEVPVDVCGHVLTPEVWRRDHIVKRWGGLLPKGMIADCFTSLPYITESDADGSNSQ